MDDLVPDIHRAILAHDNPTVERLTRLAFERGAAPASAGWMLGSAAEARNPWVANFVVSLGVDIDNELEETVVNRDQADVIVPGLLDVGANPTRALISIMQEIPPVVEGENDEWWVDVVNTKLLPLVIARGADVNQTDGLNRTPLFYAVTRSQPGITRTLLGAGARVAQPSGVNLVTLAATRRESEDILDLLFAAGASPHGQPWEVPPIWMAFFAGVYLSIPVLVEAGADPNMAFNGRTMAQLTTDGLALRVLARVGAGGAQGQIVEIPDRIAQFPDTVGKRRRL